MTHDTTTLHEERDALGVIRCGDGLVMHAVLLCHVSSCVHYVGVITLINEHDEQQRVMACNTVDINTSEHMMIMLIHESACAMSHQHVMTRTTLLSCPHHARSTQQQQQLRYS